MDKKEFEGIIEKGESDTVEFKTSLSEWKDALETLVGFSWLEGGRIIFGVSPSKKKIGVDIGKGTIEDLANNIKQNTDPKLHPLIKVFKINGKNMILVETEKTSNEPGFAFGKPYKRVGKSTHKMSRDEYKRVIKDLHEQEFDSEVCEGVGLKDVDWEFVEKFFIPKYESITKTKLAGNTKSLLESLGAIKNNKATNAGILLFGKEPQKFFMNSYIALARYKKGIGTERFDYKEFNGNIFQQIDKCDEYIKEHIAMMSRQHPMKVEREDIPEYGLFSIRELIINAVCHRDYSEQGSKVIIKMFDDYMEVYNPGGLAKDITAKNITKRQYSRNPTIAKVLSRVRYIEDMGEGWDKIIEEHKEHPLKPKPPKIISDKSSVLISLFSTKERFEKKKEMLVLNERQRKAVEYLKKHNSISISRYIILNKVSDKTARRDLNDLVKKNIITKEGVTTNLIFKLRSTSVNFGQKKKGGIIN